MKRGEMIDEDGNILKEIQDNPEGDRALSRIAVERAIANGLSRAVAERIYGMPAK